ncbi:MAG: hypothetical protein R3185_08210 [Candidatus Thermoplasmatota archaeon]|nr:hypothetical protein [Candidatus Thermoplasmatota archaeon]
MRVLLLISGGIDSPVAAKLLQENGHEVAAVHFSQAPFTDDGPEEKSLAACEHLGIHPFWVSRCGEQFSNLTKQAQHSYYFVLQKRFMLRTAERLALREGFDALATGENLGQVSSQTLQNLTCVHQAATELPVLTPLLALDKNEIVGIAEEIGTFEMSVGPEMCDALGPDHPVTWAKLDRVVEEEEKTDPEAMTEAAMAAMEPVLAPVVV